MKKGTILLLISLLFLCRLQAQDKEETLTTTTPFNFKPLPDGSFLFAYGPDGKSYEIRNYDKDFNMLSSYRLEGYNKSYNGFVVSPGNTYIYMLSPPYYPNEKLCQLKNGSEPVKFEQKGIKKLKNISIVFAGTKYLYYVSHENKQNTLKLFAIDHQTHKTKTISPQLAPQEFTRYCTGWRYAAHDSKNIYLCSKTVDFKKNTYKCKIAILDIEGKVEKQFDIAGDPKDYIYPSVSYNMHPNNSASEPDAVNQDIDGMKTQTRFTIHAYMGVTVDTTNKNIYITGAQGEKVHYSKDLPPWLSLKFGLAHWIQPRGGTSSGMFIQKFDFNGRQLWDYNLTYPKDFTKRISKALPYSRGLAIRLSPDATMLQVAHSTSTTLYGNVSQVARTNVTAEGELADKSMIEFTGGDLSSYFDCTEDVLKSNKLNGLKSIISFDVFNTGSGKVVAYLLEKTNTIHLQYYKN